MWVEGGGELTLRLALFNFRRDEPPDIDNVDNMDGTRNLLFYMMWMVAIRNALFYKTLTMLIMEIYSSTD